jgi:pilus assembly protein Flp/PilA
MREILIALHRDESGQDLIEYSLLVALIALAAVAGMSTLANNISNAFSKIGSRLSSAAT